MKSAIESLNFIGMFLGVMGLLASLVNLAHARDRISPEPGPHQRRFRWLALLFLLVTLASALCFRFGPTYLAEHWILAGIAAAAVLAVLTLSLWVRAIDNGHIRKERLHRRKSLYGAALLAAGGPLATLIGCSINPDTGKAQIDLSAIPANVHLLTTLVEDYAVIALPAGKQQDEVIRRAEQARQLADVPSLKTLLAGLQQTATGKALTTPSVPLTTAQ